MLYSALGVTSKPDPDRNSNNRTIEKGSSAKKGGKGDPEYQKSGLNPLRQKKHHHHHTITTTTGGRSLPCT